MLLTEVEAIYKSLCWLNHALDRLDVTAQYCHDWHPWTCSRLAVRSVLSGHCQFLVTYLITLLLIPALSSPFAIL